jgi:PKD repeat protein
VDSEETVGQDGAASNVYDGDPLSIWHTEWQLSNPGYPHDLRIDLGALYDVDGFRYLPRPDNGYPWDENGRIAGYEFYVSVDGVSWGAPVASGVFANTGTEKEVPFTPEAARYVRLVGLSEVNGNVWASMAELNVLGSAPSGNLAPQGVIDSPGGDRVISEGQSVVFTGTGSDPDGDVPLSYAWDFDGGAPNSSVEDPGSVVFANAGTYEVSLTVTDSQLLSDPSPAGVTVTVLPVGSSAPIPQSGWSVLYVDSEETVASSDAAVHAFDGDPATIWHTEYYSSDPGYPHELHLDLGDYYEVQGFRYLPRQNGIVNGRIHEYEFYVSLDGQSWGKPVAAGFFDDTPLEQQVDFDQITARYVRLVALSEVNGNPWASVAELNVIGTPFQGNFAPDGVIDSPLINRVISEGQSVVFTGTGSDPDGDVPLSYTWDFDGGAPSSSVEDPGSVVFANAGTYEVKLTVTDSAGRADQRAATVVVKVLPLGGDTTIAQDEWSVLYVDSEETVAENGVAENVFDSNTATIWHTNYTGSSPSHPHEIQLDLGGAFEVDTLRYYPRQDGSNNGRITRYKVYVSADGKNWGIPVAAGTFVDDASEKQLLFAPKLGQFIRLVALEESDGAYYTSAAELNVEGVCKDPSVRILDPSSNDLRSPPDLEVTASVCLDPALHAGWGIRFTLDGGQPKTVTSPPYQAVFLNAGLGEHTIKAVVVDNNGKKVSGELTSDTVTTVGVGDYYVAIGDSITTGVGDDVVSDNVSLDNRNNEGGFTPVLNNLLTMARGYPQTVVMDGILGFTSAQGLARLPLVLDHHPHSKYFLVLYGTNDSGGLLPVPSGQGLAPGNPGYPGTLKDNLQQMIDMITGYGGGGRETYLAKIPFTLNATRNTMIQQYNVAIDELVSGNAITVPPPDLYSLFQSNPGRLGDTLHPDGIGYQLIATEWFNVLY